MLTYIYSNGLRVVVAALWTVGIALAGGTAAVSALRLGGAATLPYVFVVALLGALLVGVLRRAPWALVVSLVLLGAQGLGAAGAMWELATGVSGVKRGELERLGVDAEVGVAVNLAYSLVAFTVFLVAASRYARFRRPRATR